MPVKFNEIKPGEAIIFNNEIWIVFKKDLQTRGNLRSYYQVLLKNYERGNVFNQRFSPDDNVEQAFLVRKEFEYLYTDGEMLVLMDPENYDQISLSKIMIGEGLKLLVPNLRVQIVSHNDKPLRIEMPQFVEVSVTDTPESARGDTATSVFKIATIETGAEIKVPGHIKKGDRIKVRTEDAEFIGRIN
ncbi:MAG: elongation factor P [Planctomycetota bacterium]